MNGISKDKGVIYYFNKLMLTCIKKKTQVLLCKNGNSTF